MARYCPNCGTPANQDGKFCKNCGTGLGKHEEILNKSEPPKPSRNHRLFYLAPAVIIFVLAVIFQDHIIVAYGRLTSPESINALADNSGFNVKGKSVFYSAKPELISPNTMQKVCPVELGEASKFGCYDAGLDKIYILDIEYADLNDIEYTTAAHEVLHIVWHDMSTVERSPIMAELDLLYKDTHKNRSLKESIETYKDIDDETLYHELHSFVGSEYTDELVSDKLTRHYSNYFSSRHKPVNAKFKFESAIGSKTNQLESKRKNLVDELHNIDNYKVKWIDSYAPVQQRNLYYEDYYNYNLNVDKYNINLENYERMITEYNNKVNDYNRGLIEFRTILKSFYADKELPAELSS